MQPHCNGANGYHHHHHHHSHHANTAAATEIMYSANTTTSYFPGHHHHSLQQAQLPPVARAGSANGQGGLVVQQRTTVDVFPISNRSSGQTQSVTPGVASSTSPTTASAKASPGNTNLNATGSNQNHYSPNLYSPSAIEYGITTSGSPNAATVEYENFYHSPAEAGSGGAGHPDPNIISTDSGLSYTNLDYMYANQGQHSNAGEMTGYALGTEECAPSTTPGTTNTPSPGAWLNGPGHPSQGNQGHMLIHNHMQTGAHHPSPPPPSHQHHHHGGAHLMHPGAHLHHQHPGRPYHPLDAVHVTVNHQNIQNASNLAAPGSGSPLSGSGVMHPAQLGPHSPQQQQQHQQHQQQQHHQGNMQQGNNGNNSQGSVQQFKWMQIKRNVPKPSGE